MKASKIGILDILRRKREAHYNRSYKTKQINPIQDGRFRGCSRTWGAFLAFFWGLPKIPHTYPIMRKLDTVIPYLKKIQKL